MQTSTTVICTAHITPFNTGICDVPAVMAMLKEPDPVRPPAICSVKVTEQLVDPDASAAGVKLSTPATESLGATANREGLLQLTANASGSDSPGPEVMLVAQAALYAPESSAIATTGPAVKLGGSFTAAEEVRAAA
jgi:hypothetical protein